MNEIGTEFPKITPFMSAKMGPCPPIRKFDSATNGASYDNPSRSKHMAHFSVSLENFNPMEDRPTVGFDW